MKPVLSLFVSALALLASARCLADEDFPVVHHEPITVRVLDGKTGDPQPGAHVILTGGYAPRDLALGLWQEEAVTDANGGVQLSDALRNLPLLHIHVLKLQACALNAGSRWNLERIRLTGMSAANRCGSFVAVNAPGVFNVSVKGKPLAPGKASGPSQTSSQSVPAMAGAIAGQAPLSEAEIDQVLAEQY
jgi:hypothetical protein